MGNGIFRIGAFTGSAMTQKLKAIPLDRIALAVNLLIKQHVE
jgi:hypothetical protein